MSNVPPRIVTTGASFTPLASDTDLFLQINSTGNCAIRFDLMTLPPFPVGWELRISDSLGLVANTNRIILYANLINGVSAAYPGSGLSLSNTPRGRWRIQYIGDTTGYFVSGGVGT